MGNNFKPVETEAVPLQVPKEKPLTREGKLEAKMKAILGLPSACDGHTGRGSAFPGINRTRRRQIMRCIRLLTKKEDREKTRERYLAAFGEAA